MRVSAARGTSRQSPVSGWDDFRWREMDGMSEFLAIYDTGGVMGGCPNRAHSAPNLVALPSKGDSKIMTPIKCCHLAILAQTLVIVILHFGFRRP